MRGKRLICVVLLLAVMLMSACGSKEEQEFYYSPGDPFVSNVYEQSGTLIKIVLVVGMCEDATEKLTEKNAIIRDSLLRIVRGTPIEVLQAENAQEVLSQTMTAKLNELFPPGEKDKFEQLFTRVYFQEFVVQ